MRRFDVWFNGSFYAYALLDSKGREMYTLAEAAELAEDMYGEDWKEVANGEEGISREEWLEQLQQA